jgi:predicted HTH transcriptional regulator
MRMKESMEKYELPGPYIEAGKHLFTITFVQPDLQNKTICKKS